MKVQIVEGRFPLRAATMLFAGRLKRGETLTQTLRQQPALAGARHIPHLMNSLL